MPEIHCPWCGSPVTVYGDRWECGWCGDCGSIASLSPSEKEKLVQEANSSITLSFSFEGTDAEEEKRTFTRQELEDMVRRWDFEENPWACRDFLLASFPEQTAYLGKEKPEEMDTMDLVLEVGQRDPETGLRMIMLLLDTAQEHLQEEETAQQLLGWDLADLIMSEKVLPLLLEELRHSDTLAQQIFASAHSDDVQKEVLAACDRAGDAPLKARLLRFWEKNPYRDEDV